MVEEVEMSKETNFYFFNFFLPCSFSRCINLKINHMYTFSFERLDVWKKSRLLTKMIYKTTVNFPDSEKFGITGQIRRAIISVCSNPVK